MDSRLRGNDIGDSLYIHIPFCGRKCLYCDFYSIPLSGELSKAYVGTLVNQIDGLDGFFTTVYIGGGTPTLLDPKSLSRLLIALRPKLKKDAEFTVEANPESLDREKLKVLRDGGVNRISIGVQSLDDGKLMKLGRPHDAKRSRESVYLAEAEGFSNISIDLIFGVWSESLGSWKNELDKAALLPVKHISCYSLTYEKGTPLFSSVQNNSIKPLEGDKAAKMYEAAMDLLPRRGFEQYEVSNFAKGDGFRCRHNLNYWENNPYIGLGASAVSYMDGVRAKNVSDVREYLRRCEERLSAIDFTEKLSSERSAKETAAIKVRTSDGIDFKWFKEKTGYDFQVLESSAIADLVGKGLIEYKTRGGPPTDIALKINGYLYCDTVSSALL